jgi:membrane-associated phospholipid phosphatase
MAFRVVSLTLATVLLSWSGSAVAETADPSAGAVAPPAQAQLRPLDGLLRHLGGAFSGINLVYPLVAIAATTTMATQEVDLNVHNYFHDHPNWGRAAYPSVILGVAGPVALFGGLHIIGKATDNTETLGAAYAVLQAGALTLGYVTVLKLFLGRPAPRDENIPSVAPDEEKLSRTFRPGFYRGGVIAGWPSGHVAVTTAVLGALVAYYPDSVWLKLVMTVGVAGMVLGVSSFDQGGFHWASDAVAGALMAFPIGTSTGRGMRRLVDGRKAGTESAWFLAPSLGGVLVGRSF